MQSKANCPLPNINDLGEKNVLELTQEQAFNWEDNSISQCSNVYVFLGLGLILSQAREVSAVETVASCVKDQQDGRLFPQIKDLADVSKKVALAVAEEVMRLGLTSMSASIEFEERLKKIVWEPAYLEIRKTGILRRWLSAVFRR